MSNDRFPTSDPNLRRAGAILALALLGGLAHAQGGPPPPPPPPPPLGPPPPPPVGNPTTPNKVLLGKALFWDEQLSSTKTVACASCHIPESGGVDPRSVDTNAHATNPGPNGVFGDADDVVGSPGVVRNLADGSYELHASFGLGTQVTPRQAPSVLNAAYAPLQFWDGRAGGSFVDPLTNLVVLPNGASLETQALGPLVSDVEMGNVGRLQTDVTARVIASQPLALSPALSPDLVPFVAGQTYPDLFQVVFGTNEVTPVRIAEAIAAYERTQFTNQAPIDALAANPAALTPLENQGRAIFNSPQTNCNICHAGPLTTNQSFQYIGVRPQDEDLGRFNVTNDPADRGRFKVPGLRNVELRAPYFHDGSMRTLEDVVDFYNRGGDFNAPNKNPLIRPLGLTDTQKQALLAFLRRPLTDPRVPLKQAPFDHPSLYAGSFRAPTTFGAGSPGSGGFVPHIVSLEPPLVGNPSFTIGIEKTLGGARAVLAIDLIGIPGGKPFRGVTSYLDMGTSVVIVRAGHTNGIGDGAGWISRTLSIPSDSSLIGTTRFAQWFILDPSVPGGGFSASEAVRFTYF